MFKILFLFLIFFVKTSSPSCELNKNNCSKCNPLTKLCAICAIPEIYKPDKNGGCSGSLRCEAGKNYCNECDINGYLCKKCEKGYYPDDNGACSYTENCKISYKGECLECLQNFIKVGKKGEWQICKYFSSDDFNHCKKINYEKGYYELCEDNYYLSKENKCIKTKNCQDSIFGNCIKCKYGFYYNKKDENYELKNNYDFLFCQQSFDNKTCEVCDTNNYFDEEGICSPTNYCSKSVNATCQKYISGYYLTGNSVCSNTDNCANGDKDTEICNNCKNKYYLDTKDYLCKTNLKNNDFIHCIKTEEDKCTQCEKNYYLGEDFKCSSTKNCSESKNGICFSCIKNNYLDLNNNCTDIEHCIYASDVYYKCLECENGYYYSKKYRKCFAYNNDSIYNNCKYSCDQLEQYCKCKDNYYLRNNDSLCFSNKEKGPFYKCSESDWNGERCYECEEPYFLGVEDYLCNLVDNCALIENEFKCKKCWYDYCLDANKGICIENYLVKNESDKKYFACNRTNKEGTECEDCLYGFKLGEKGLCVNYDNCTERENGYGICLKCENKFCANNDFGCIYNYDQNCIRCDNFTDFNWCTECEKGYKINNTYGFCEEIINDTKTDYL